MKEDSLKKRYFYKLSTNFFGMALGLITAGMVPRALGPIFYGNYSFLTNFFMQITNFLDMGTSTAFYTKLSQRPRDKGLVSFYLYFIGIVCIAILLFVFFASITPLFETIWPGQAIYFVFLAAGWAIFNFIIKVFNKMTDAYGLTVSGEMAKMVQKIVSTVLVVLLFVSHRLNLVNYFYLQYVLFVLLGAILVLIIRRSSFPFFDLSSISFEKAKTYFKEFYNYSHPLVVYALVVMLVGVLQRWLLQYFAGSVQQGFYSLSYNLAEYCFVFTLAMQPLLMREFAVAHGNNNLKQMAVLFRKYIPLFYSIAAYFSCFLAVQAKTVVHIFGGGQYEMALLPMIVMSFYPIHQTYGQLSSSVFYATGQTALYRNIGVGVAFASLIITYFLLAPLQLWGLGMGALGLAIQMVAMQFITVNIQLYFNARYLGFSFLKYFGHQIGSVMVFVSLSLAATFFGSYFLDAHIVYDFIFSGVLYSVLALLVFLCFPAVFGLNKKDIYAIIETAKGRLNV